MLMLRRIAWRMQEDADGLRANAIADDVLRGVLKEFFTTEWRFEEPKARRAATEMINRLQERNWGLTLRGPRLYGFVHRTFLEYLCALELTERFKAHQLNIEQLIQLHVVPRLADDAWHEVLHLLVGALPVAAVEQIATEQILLAILPESETAKDFESR